MIDSDKVFRATPQIPGDGMSMITTYSPTDSAKGLPPFLGVWKQMTPSQITIWTAFSTMGFQLHSGNAPDIPTDELGLYFGPEPKLLSVTADFIKQELMVFQIQNRFAKDKSAWDRKVLVFLENCGLNQTFAERWRLTGTSEHPDLLTSFISDIR